MPMPLTIEDGYTETRLVPSTPGLHPELRIVYRPCLDRERAAFRLKNQSTDPTVIDNHTTDLITGYVVSINGEEFKDKARAAKLRPAIRAYCVDAILGYSPASEEADAKNS